MKSAAGFYARRRGIQLLFGDGDGEQLLLVVAVVLHAAQSEGMLAVGGQIQIKLGAQLGSREVDIGIVLGRDVAGIMAQNFQQEAAGIREVDGVSSRLHSAIAVGAVSGVIIEHQSLGQGGHIGGRGDGLGGRVHGVDTGAGRGADFILGADGAIGIQRIDEGDFSAGGADGGVRQNGTGAGDPFDLFTLGDGQRRVGGGNPLGGTGLRSQQAQIEQSVAAGEFAGFSTFNFVFRRGRWSRRGFRPSCFRMRTDYIFSLSGAHHFGALAPTPFG